MKRKRVMYIKGRMFISTKEFEKKWESLGLNDEDLRRLENEIVNNPQSGAVIQGTGGIRKIRFSFEGKGKSGSVRVIYIDILITEKVILLGAFAKREQDNLSKAQKNTLKNIANEIKRFYKEEIL
jgi:hypothetical protein